ncbi:MAG: DUF2892 domain-containing protein [Anaerolineae bacterium]|nr:DUF2892 domain-containing protein [Anaerolineae bacterium]
MKKNIGDLDKLLRTILGIYAMLFGFLFLQNVAGIIVGILGVVSLITGQIGWCGIYHLLNISTVKEDAAKPQSETAN